MTSKPEDLLAEVKNPNRSLQDAQKKGFLKVPFCLAKDRTDAEEHFCSPIRQPL